MPIHRHHFSSFHQSMLSLRTKQTMATWNSIFGLSFEAITPKRTPRRIQIILLSVLVSLLSSSHASAPFSVSVDGRLIKARISKALFFIRTFLQPLFSRLPFTKNRHRPWLLRWTSRLQDFHALQWFLASHFFRSVTRPLTTDCWSTFLPRFNVFLCTFRLTFTRCNA